MGDLLTFRRMVTPVLIQFIFWLGFLGCLGYGGYYTYWNGLRDMTNPSQLDIVIGVGIIFLGPLGVRIICEIFILFFRINETLTDIMRNTDRG